MPDDSNQYDIGAIADSIGKDLFPADTPVDAGGGGNPGGPAPAVGAPPPPAPPADEWLPMPKAWKKEKQSVWDSLAGNKDVREYIHAREADVVKGFDQYATGYKSWNELISPFQQVIAAHPNVNPVQVMQNLMKNHLALLSASPEQKRAMAQHLLKSYGVDLGTPGAPPAAQIPPEVAALQGEVGQLRDALGRFTSAEQTRQLEANKQLVESFAKDPANKHFDEVADDILHLIQTGAAPDLKTAYEMACWTNPVVRAKLLAEQPGKPVPPKPLNVEGMNGGTPPAKPKTFEDTLESVMVKNYGEGWRNAH